MSDVLEPSAEWSGTSSDPNDRQFGHVVEQASIDDADDYEVVLVGEPFDGAVIGRPGARDGPTGIRSALAGVKTHHFELGDVAGPHGLQIADLGDIVIPDGDAVATAHNRVRTVTAAVHDTASLPVFVGGDNSLTYPNVAPLFDSRDRVGVINVDAHLDCREVRGQPSSGSPYRQLHDASLETLVVVGARHFETSTSYVEYLEEQDGSVITAEAVRSDPTAAATEALNAFEGHDAVYVSVDIDVLDATAAPGVSAPTPGGLPSRELFELVRGLTATPKLAGFEVVETAPPLCPDGRTAAAAARTIAHAVAGYARTNRSTGENQ